MDNMDIKEELTEKEKLAELRNKNPNLPEEILDILLKRFLKCVNGNLDDAKRIIELNYSLRNKHADIFIDRDPQEESLQEYMKINDFIPLPGLTRDNRKVLFSCFKDSDASKVNPFLECKIFHLIADGRFSMSDAEKVGNVDDDVDSELDLADGDIQFADMANMSFWHMMRVPLSIMRLQIKFVQEAYPTKLYGTHIINAPTFIDKIFSFIKPFIKDEVFESFRIHSNIESVYEHIPRDMLPNEYGGKAGTIDELKANLLNSLEEKRSYLMDPKYWKVQEKKSRWSWW